MIGKPADEEALITCRNGHPCPMRRADGRCPVCVKASRQRTYDKYRVEIQAKDRIRSKLRLADHAPRRRAWRVNNAEHIRALKRQWYANNKERYKAAQVRYRLRHPERTKVLKQRNRLDRVARERGAPGSHTYDDLLRIFASQHGRCKYCDVSLTLGTVNCQIDHVLPLTRGGSHDPDNLAFACKSCNCRKSNRTPEEWAAA